MQSLGGRLLELVKQLDATGPRPTLIGLARAMAASRLTPADVASFVQTNAQSYNRARFILREHYELMIMTWLPGQASFPHDHNGSICVMQTVQGEAAVDGSAPFLGSPSSPHGAACRRAVPRNGESQRGADHRRPGDFGERGGKRGADRHPSTWQRPDARNGGWLGHQLHRPDALEQPESNPVIGSLLVDGWLCQDELALGIETTADGHAIAASGGEVPDLFVVGTLRKPAFWESTAVPELSEQAETVARKVFDWLMCRGGIAGPAQEGPHARTLPPPTMGLPFAVAVAARSGLSR
jgi:Cysteine dioxygenase type I